MKTIGLIGGMSYESTITYYQVVNKVIAEGIILGCTEIGSLVQQEDTPIPLFDTTLIHATRAALNAVCPEDIN